MYSITCPVCNNTTFSPDEKSFDTSFNCGTVFSGKYGKSKRQKERVTKENRFTITLQDCSDLKKILNLKEEGGI